MIQLKLDQELYNNLVIKKDITKAINLINSGAQLENKYPRLVKAIGRIGSRVIINGSIIDVALYNNDEELLKILFTKLEVNIAVAVGQYRTTMEFTLTKLNHNEPDYLDTALLLIKLGYNISKAPIWEISNLLNHLARHNREELFDLLQLIFKTLDQTQQTTILTQAQLLHTAVESQNIRLVEHLLNLGMNINSLNSVGLSPLHIAIILGDKTLLNCLVEHQADVNTLDQYGHSALDYADKTLKNSAIIKILKTKSALSVPNIKSITEKSEIVLEEQFLLNKNYQHDSRLLKKVEQPLQPTSHQPTLASASYKSNNKTPHRSESLLDGLSKGWKTSILQFKHFRNYLNTLPKIQQIGFSVITTSIGMASYSLIKPNRLLPPSEHSISTHNSPASLTTHSTGKKWQQQLKNQEKQSKIRQEVS
ncbi:ankyrin repeat domain-containing protein [Rickettsiales endosymbiont of Stachyamoeba lipophora]|uniref:ankyrin repeat domain-containing protein n=1 Tax=Rickettsiales endosymbiont of Stachyamoeba lipophora TaxID=2486578 RepID=UPI000F64702E|nr:ankyrin repeat domain-containing protein [Rickettsiales endosymbiont of Stachyamoeba lipophora]AZL16249.1 ankyrin repeat domain-containing protein [Rickettsiales endosymbiont of Stachyamoeba lipophora]